MAETLRIARYDGSAYYNLLSGSLRLARGGFVPKATRPSMSPVVGPYGGSAEFSHFPRQVETLDLMAKGVSQTNLISAAASIDYFLDEARRWFYDPFAFHSYWLEHQVDSESAKRRALIYGGGLEWTNKPGFPGGMWEDGQAFARVGIERHPFWEDASSKPHSSAAVDTFGGVWDLSAVMSETGTAPSRISEFRLTGRTGEGPSYRWWIGIRDYNQGFSSFDAVWQCDDGDASMDTDTSVTANGGASSGYVMRTTFGTDASLKQRFSIQLSDVVGSNYNHFVGRYLVLMRANFDTSIAVQLRYGYEGTAGFRECPPAYTPETGAWRLVALGEIEIPPGGYKTESYATMSALGSFELQLYAERIGTSGSLYCDAFLLVPSQHMITLDDCDTTFSDDDYRWWYAKVLPDDTPWAELWEGFPTTTPALSITKSMPPSWVLPKRAAFAVIVSERENFSSYGDQVDVYMAHVPRWRTLKDT